MCSNCLNPENRDSQTRPVIAGASMLMAVKLAVSRPQARLQDLPNRSAHPFIDGFCVR